MERAGLASSLLQPQLLLVSQPTATIELLFCLLTYKPVSFPLVCSSLSQLIDRPAIFARKIALLYSICKHFVSSQSSGKLSSVGSAASAVGPDAQRDLRSF